MKFTYTNVNSVIRFGCGKSQCSCVTTSEQFSYSENMNQPCTNTAIYCKTELKTASCKFVAFWEVADYCRYAENAKCKKEKQI